MSTLGLRAINVLGPKELTGKDPVPRSARDKKGPFYMFVNGKDPRYEPGIFCGVFTDL